MHPYIKHLLLDIKNTKRPEEECSRKSYPVTLEEEMAVIEHYISGEGEQALSYFTGLKKEHFPPNEQLSEEDIKLVMKSFIGMFRTWNASIEFPANMPWRALYEFLINHVLEESFTPVNSGLVQFDFCTGDSSDCVWEKFCSCLKYDDR